MMEFIDAFLNKITMYRLVLYVLIGLALGALFYSAFGMLPFSPIALFFSTLFLLAVSWVTNWAFSRVFDAPTNVESVYITALILALIITPAQTLDGYIFLLWAAVLSMALKYILAIRRKHIFNPAAIAVVVTAIAANHSASWWIGTLSMLPLVIIGGFLMVRKLRETAVVVMMIGVAMVTIIALTMLDGGDFVFAFTKTITGSALIFFATIMFTEPLTMPPTRSLRMVYAALVGVLFAPQLHIGHVYSSPEIALVVGNIFSYIVSPKVRRMLNFVSKKQIATDTYDFVFSTDKPFSFRPGSYMEWTLPHMQADARGNRRYFTIASSPTEQEIHLGVKFYPQSSSFKKALDTMQPGQHIVAAQVAGDFVLPKDASQKCVFIAGGIGVTPFRSMIQYLLDTNEKRTITMFYAAKKREDFAYWEMFEQAKDRLGIQTIYVPSDEQGMITPDLIKKHVPDYTEYMFYISGPRAMVDAFRESLREMGISRSNIKTDFFPGFV